ncbi:MAG: isoprenylcysteine carboxylmethyltransferase family protein [Mariprofundaceae bacterium]
MSLVDWQSMAWIVLSGLVFAVSHSLLASKSLKLWAYQRGLKEPRYRLMYSIVGIFSTGIWLWFVHALPDAPLYDVDGLLRMVLYLVQGAGVIIALAAFQPIDGLVFLGLRKAKASQDPLIVRGIYRWLRHPMYAGAILILLAMPTQTFNGLCLSLVICMYFMVGSRYEEGRMLAEHSEYADYRDKVGAFIPKWRRLS